MRYRHLSYRDAMVVRSGRTRPFGDLSHTDVSTIQALDAVRATGGTGVAVPEDAIIAIQLEVARSPSRRPRARWPALVSCASGAGSARTRRSSRSSRRRG